MTNETMGQIMDYEAGTLSPESTLKLFSSLIGSGLAWQLQGHYGRMARDLIGAGFIGHDGVINWEAFENAQEEQSYE